MEFTEDFKNPIAEQCLLGSILADNKILSDVQLIVSKEMFYSTANQIIYDVMLDLHSNKKAIDLSTLFTQLRAESVEYDLVNPIYLTKLFDLEPTAINWKMYAGQVKDKHFKRQLLSYSRLEASDIHKNVKALVDNYDKDITTNFKVTTMSEAFKTLKGDVNSGKLDRVMKTGIIWLDNCTYITRDDVTVIASLSNTGKSSLVVTLIKNNPDKKILYVSIEEGEQRALLRLKIAGVFTDNVYLVEKRDKQITDRDLSALYEYVDGVDFIIIDQLINMDSDTKEERFKYKKLMEKFRELSRFHGIPVFLVHQLGRSAISTEEPRKEQLAEGADIERLAYNVWLLHRVKSDRGNSYTMLKIDKAKHSKCPLSVPIEYDFKTNTFINFDKYSSEKMEDLKIMNISTYEIDTMDLESEFLKKISIAMKEE